MWHRHLRKCSSFVITGFITGLTRMKPAWCSNLLPFRNPRVHTRLLVAFVLINFSSVRAYQSLVFCVVLCRSLFIHLSFLLAIVCFSPIYEFWVYCLHLISCYTSYRGIFFLCFAYFRLRSHRSEDACHVPLTTRFVCITYFLEMLAFQVSFALDWSK